jgi:GT2 family glycosyltransferase
MNTCIFVVHNVKSRSKEILGMTDTCLSSFRETASDTYELMLVDNGSNDDGECFEFLHKFATDPGRNEQNLPIAAVWNNAIELAKGDVIMLLNNDAIFNRRNWMSQLTEALRGRYVGAAGSRKLSWNGFDFLEGSFLAFYKATAEAIAEDGKIFDERFEFTCEEVDFCTRLLRAGYILIDTGLERNNSVTHLHHGTLSWSNEDGGWNGKSILDVMHGCRIKLCRKYGKADRVDD